MILVTGCTGFIGRRLVRKLVANYGPQNVLCLVRPEPRCQLEISGRDILRELNVAYVEGDLLTGVGLEKVEGDINTVFHLAACTDTGDRDHSINDVGAKNLLARLRELKSVKKLIFTSTIAAADHRELQERPCDESTPLLVPFSEYGRRKLMTEQILKAAAVVERFDLDIVRVCAVFGAGPKKSGLYDSLAQLCKKDSILARFNYPGKMAVVYVEDLAECLAGLAERPFRSGATDILIPSVESLSVEEFATSIYRHIGKTKRSILLPAFLWRLFSNIARLIYFSEPLIPHILYNKLWQLSILVNSNYDNRSIRINELFPKKKFMMFSDAVAEMVAE